MLRVRDAVLSRSPSCGVGFAGAHLNWADYSPLSRLTALTDLQLAHCSGALPMHWLAASPGLARLYVKGNGAAAGQTVALAGSPAVLSLLASLRELYLGLCEFTQADGAPRVPHASMPACARPAALRYIHTSRSKARSTDHECHGQSCIDYMNDYPDSLCQSIAIVAGHTRVCPAPCFSHLSTVHNLRALTIVDCPFATDAAGPATPVASTLGALGSLTKLRIGHSGRVSALRGVSPHNVDAAGARAVHDLYAAVGQLDLLDLTLDCHPQFGVKDLQAVVSGTPLLHKAP